MNSNSSIILKAEFNEAIKTYILLVVAIIMLISIVGIPILVIWFLGLGQYISSRYYKSLQCKLTERHLEFSKGVLFSKEKTIPLENIQDLTFIQNPLLSILGLRILKIETAGQSNPQGMSDMRLVGIIEPVEFKEKVLEQRIKIIKEDRSGGSQPINLDTETIHLLREIRDILEMIKAK